MAFHPDSPPMVLYLRNSIDELIGPIEAVWKEGDGTVNGRQLISVLLFAIGHCFATVDGDLSDDEISFLADVTEFLTGTEYGRMPIGVLTTDETLSTITEADIPKTQDLGSQAELRT